MVRWFGVISFLSSGFVVVIGNAPRGRQVLHSNAYPSLEKLTLISPTAFGGLLASAIGKMDGMRGYLGIYISEHLFFISVMLNTQRMAMDLYP